MTNTELKKYGNVEVTFAEMYKHHATYINKEVGVKCTFIVEYRDTINLTETVLHLMDYEYFKFELIKTK